MTTCHCATWRKLNGAWVALYRIRGHKHPAWKKRKEEQRTSATTTPTIGYVR